MSASLFQPVSKFLMEPLHETLGIPREARVLCLLWRFWISSKNIRMNGEGSFHIFKALVLRGVSLNQWPLVGE